MTIKIVTEKFCPGCKIVKPAKDFNKANRRDGLRSYCKSCDYKMIRNKIESIKEQIYDKHGHYCFRCGYTDKRALQIDHVLGGGTKEREVFKSTTSYLKKVLADETGSYQILCANCNWIKRAEEGEEAFGSVMSEQGRQRMSEAARNRVVSEETRQKQSAIKMGKPLSEEHRQKLITSITESWEDPEIRASRVAGLQSVVWSDERRDSFREVATKREAVKREKRLSARVDNPTP